MLDRSNNKSMRALEIAMQVAIDVLKFVRNANINKIVKKLDQEIYDFYEFIIFPLIVGQYDFSMKTEFLEESIIQGSLHRTYGDASKEKKETVNLYITCSYTEIKVGFHKNREREWETIPKKYINDDEGIIIIPTKEVELTRFSNHNF